MPEEVEFPDLTDLSRTVYGGLAIRYCRGRCTLDCAGKNEPLALLAGLVVPIAEPICGQCLNCNGLPAKLWNFATPTMGWSCRCNMHPAIKVGEMEAFEIVSNP